MAQLVKFLSSKCKALSSTPITTKKRRRRKQLFKLIDYSQRNTDGIKIINLAGNGGIYF
jgi:hypothetical protein